MGGPGGEGGHSVALDSLGNIYVTGYASPGSLLLKFSSSGNILWQETWGGFGDDGYGVTVDGVGNVYVTGVTYSFGAGGADVFLIQFGSSGMLHWQKTWGGYAYGTNGGGDDVGFGIALDPPGNIYVGGYTRSFGIPKSDALLLKLNSTGSLLNQEISGGPGLYGAGEDVGYGLAVNSTGDAFITGTVLEQPPYQSTTIGNNTLGTPSFYPIPTSFTLGTPTAAPRTSTGSVSTPAGSQTYAGTRDVFLRLYAPTPQGVPALPSSLVTLAGLLLITTIIMSRRRNFTG